MKQTRLKQNKVKDKTIYNFLIKLSFSSIKQNNSKFQKEISKLLILIEKFTFKFLKCYILSIEMMPYIKLKDTIY